MLDKKRDGTRNCEELPVKDPSSQGWEKRIDNFTLGEGVMPESFKVGFDLQDKKERLVADFGGSAIGRVAPVDSGLWWIILTKCAHDYSLADLPVVQKGMKLILILCLSYGFDTFPTLLCADGCSMIEKEWRVFSSFFFLSFIELKLVKMAARMLGISEELRIHF